MGALCTSGDVIFEEKPGVAGQDDIAMTIFTKHLDLGPKDLDKFYRMFTKLEDIERSRRIRDAEHKRKIQIRNGKNESELGELVIEPSGGMIHKDTLYEYLGIPVTVVNQRLFAAFADPHFTGKINFVPFVSSIWHFLSFNAKWVANYLFFLFNDQNRHYLTHGQLISLINTILDKVVEIGTLKRLTRTVPRLPIDVTLPVYHAFLEKNPIVTQPFLTLHEKLRSKCFGVKYWKRMQAKRFKHKNQMCTNYLVQLNTINLDLYHKRKMAAEVDERMDEWRKQKESQPQGQEDGALPDRFCDPATALNMPPPSLKVCLKLGGPDGGEKPRRPKKKRKRHSRKPPSQEPFGGPAEWLGRNGPLPVLQISPKVMAALEEKNALKAEQRERRAALRGKNARIAAEKRQEDEKKMRQLNETAQERHARELREFREQQQPEKPRIKYLPKLEHGLKPTASASIKPQRLSYVDNLE
mmetsp:Transcript_14882/g.27954  ORF Transcript_14882/g.27954 Transcript_14882/m.27954 type:complete len:469 (+) Transcript_14882:280-1686(+)